MNSKRCLKVLIKIIKEYFPNLVINFEILKLLDNDFLSVSMVVKVYECKSISMDKCLCQGFAVSMLKSCDEYIPDNLHVPIEYILPVKISINEELEKLFTIQELIAVAQIRALEEAIMMLGIDVNINEDALSTASSNSSINLSNNSFTEDSDLNKDRNIAPNNSNLVDKDTYCLNSIEKDNELKKVDCETQQITMIDDTFFNEKKEKRETDQSKKHTKAYETINNILEENCS